MYFIFQLINDRRENKKEKRKEWPDAVRRLSINRRRDSGGASTKSDIFQQIVRRIAPATSKPSEAV